MTVFFQLAENPWTMNSQQWLETGQLDFWCADYKQEVGK